MYYFAFGIAKFNPLLLYHLRSEISPACDHLYLIPLTFDLPGVFIKPRSLFWCQVHLQSISNGSNLLFHIYQFCTKKNKC